MINALVVQNYLGESETIHLANPKTSGFAITSIEGVSPGDATINVSDIASSDGAYFNSSRKSSRPIAVNMRLMDEPSCEYNRHKLARLFPLKQWVRLYFVADERISYIEGYVESNAVEIFTSPVTARVSVLCPEPYFHSIEDDTIVFSGDNPVFEFDFEIPTSMEFSQYLSYTEQNVFYDGEEPIGVMIKIHSVGTVGADIKIYDLQTNEVITIDYAKLVSITGSGLVAGDDLTICTVKGSKSATLLRSGVSMNVLNAIARDANWFQLLPGDNLFVYTCTSGVSNLQFQISHGMLYYGV